MTSQHSSAPDQPTPEREPWPTLSEMGIKAAYAAAGASGIAGEKLRARVGEEVERRRERRERRREQFREARGFLNDLPNQSRHLPGQAGVVAERVSALVEEWAEKGRADVASARERWGDRLKGDPAARRAERADAPTEEPGTADLVDDTLVEPDVAEAEPVPEPGEETVVEDVDGVVIVGGVNEVPGDEPRPM